MGESVPITTTKGEQLMNKDLEQAIKAVTLAELSLHPSKAPKYSKDTIEQARQETSTGLILALSILKDLSVVLV